MGFNRLIARYRHRQPAKRYRLDAIDPGETPFCSGDDSRDEARSTELAERLAELQQILRAQKRHRVLVILQGMDASGKDGTVRSVLGRMSPLGVRALSWDEPTPEEQAHDPLWRMHRETPAAGELVVFNRSHYEDAIEPMVRGGGDRRRFRQRCAQFNDFERMLAENGTLICKFFLHISNDEQRRRLQARIDEPEKRWKFDPEDLQVRRHWKAYQDCYAALIQATGTRWAPWHVVPADSKTHRDLMVASTLLRALKGLKLRYPPGDTGWAGMQVQ